MKEEKKSSAMKSEKMFDGEKENCSKTEMSGRGRGNNERVHALSLTCLSRLLTRSIACLLIVVAKCVHVCVSVTFSLFLSHTIVSVYT